MERAALRIGSRFIRQTMLMRVLVCGKKLRMSSRWSASSGRSISTKPMSSAPASRQSRRSQSALRLGEVAWSVAASTRSRNHLTVGCSESIVILYLCMLYIQLIWRKKKRAAPPKSSDSSRRPVLQFGLETFQPGAERYHATLKTRKRSDGRFHLRPYRQTLDKFIEFLGRLGAHNHDEPDSSVRRSTCQDLLFVFQLLANLQAGKNVLLDERNPVLGPARRASVSCKFHVNQILHLFLFFLIVMLLCGSSVETFCSR